MLKCFPCLFFITVLGNPRVALFSPWSVAEVSGNHVVPCSLSWMWHSGPGSEALAFTYLCGNITTVETWLYCVVQFIPSYTIKAAIPLSQPPK